MEQYLVTESHVANKLINPTLIHIIKISFQFSLC